MRNRAHRGWLARSCFALFAFGGTASAQDALHEALVRLRSAQPSEYEAAVEAVLALEPEPDEVAARLIAGVAPPRDASLKAGWNLRRAIDLQGVERPYQIYVPATALEADEPLRLLVHLHGAVGREDFATTIGAVGYGQLLWEEPANEGGFVIAFPLGRQDCLWWTSSGRNAIYAVVRDVKRVLAIDEQKVTATGFSDGGSACYGLAISHPDPFAALLPMNGHPAVVAGASELPLYPKNIAATPMIAAMTLDDPLYPGHEVLRHLLPALEAKGPVQVISYPTGGHQPVYFDQQREVFLGFLRDAKRDTWQRELEWRCSPGGGTRFRWIEVLEFEPLASGGEALATASQVLSSPGRIRLGIEFAGGDDLEIARVVMGSVAERLGVRTRDVLVQVNGEDVLGSFDIRGALEQKTYGDQLVLLVQRGRARVTLEGRLPAFTPQPLYRRDAPAAWVRARFEEGRLEIEAHGARRVRVELPRALLGEGELVVVQNGETTRRSAERIPLRERLAAYARTLDFASLADSRLDLEWDRVR